MGASIPFFLFFGLIILVLALRAGQSRGPKVVSCEGRARERTAVGDVENLEEVRRGNHRNHERKNAHTPLEQNFRADFPQSKGSTRNQNDA